MSDATWLCAICERLKPLSWSQDVEVVRSAFPLAVTDSDRGRVCADCLEALIRQRTEKQRGSLGPPKPLGDPGPTPDAPS